MQAALLAGASRSPVPPAACLQLSLPPLANLSFDNAANQDCIRSAGGMRPLMALPQRLGTSADMTMHALGRAGQRGQPHRRLLRHGAERVPVAKLLCPPGASRLPM